VFSYMQGGCTFSTSTEILVFNTPTADFTAVDEECVTSSVSITYTGNAPGDADYDWSFDNGQILSGSGAGPYSIMWDSPGTKNISLTVEHDGCVSEEFSREVNLNAELLHPTIQCATTTGAITFTWNDVPDNDGYSLNILEGPTGSRNGNQYEVTGLSPGDSVMIELITMGNGICPDVRDTMICYAQDCPTPDISIFPLDTTLCLYPGTGTINFEAVVTGGGGSGNWSGPGITDPMNGVFDPMDASTGPGTYTITYNYMDQGCPFMREATVTINEVPVAAVANTSYILTCENDNELTLDASPSSPAGSLEYYWSTTEGVLLTDPSLPQVTAGGAGDYQLLVVHATTGCRDSVVVTLGRDADAPTADAGEDAVLNCNVMAWELGGPNTSTGPDIHHYWSSPTGNFISDPNAPMVMVDAPGMYNLMVVDSSNGCQDQDEIVIDLDVTPPTPTVSVSDMLTCDITSVDLTSMVLQGSGNYLYSWSTSNGVIQGATDGASILATSAGMFKLVVTDQQTGCQDSIDVEVLADNDVVSGIDFEIDYPGCFGDQDGRISIIGVIGGTAPFTYSWSNGASTPEIVNLGGGSYTLELEDANGCGFTRTFELPIPVDLTADIGPDIFANINEEITISLNTNIDVGAVDSIAWNGPLPSCFNCVEVTFPAEESGSILATVIDTNGCQASASLNLTVIVPIDIFTPNVFSPNGDGANDNFTIYGNTLVEVNEFQVFDRWGELVHEMPSFVPGQPAWNGQINGKEVAAGVYVYKAQLVHNTGLVEYQIGDITLVR
jgi:gliding motility-associated-like protein